MNGSNINITLHVWFEYPICVPSFVLVRAYTGQFCCTLVDVEEQEEEEDDDYDDDDNDDDDETTRVISI